MKTLDTEDRVAELFLELANKLMREYRIAPDQIARTAIGLAAHMYMEYHQEGGQAGAAFMRQNADALEALCAPQPASSLN